MIGFGKWNPQYWNLEGFMWELSTAAISSMSAVRPSSRSSVFFDFRKSSSTPDTILSSCCSMSFISPSHSSLPTEILSSYGLQRAKHRLLANISQHFCTATGSSISQMSAINSAESMICGSYIPFVPAFQCFTASRSALRASKNDIIWERISYLYFFFKTAIIPIGMGWCLAVQFGGR